MTKSGPPHSFPGNYDTVSCLQKRLQPQSDPPQPIAIDLDEIVGLTEELLCYAKDGLTEESEAAITAVNELDAFSAKSNTLQGPNNHVLRHCFPGESGQGSPSVLDLRVCVTRIDADKKLGRV